MAFPYQNNTYYPQQPMFPQPQGNVYVIQNSLEVANIPAGAGITAALCPQENLLYMKSMQNGMPVFLAYKLAPYNDSPKLTTPTLEERMTTVENQLTTIVNALGGNNDVQQSTTTTQTNANTKQWDT